MFTLYLVRGAPLGDDDVAGLLDDGDAVRVEQLPVSLPALAKLELEAALAVEDLKKGRYLEDLKFVKTFSSRKNLVAGT